MTVVDFLLLMLGVSRSITVHSVTHEISGDANRVPSPSIAVQPGEQKGRMRKLRRRGGRGEGRADTDGRQHGRSLLRWSGGLEEEVGRTRTDGDGPTIGRKQSVPSSEPG